MLKKIIILLFSCLTLTGCNATNRELVKEINGVVINQAEEENYYNVYLETDQTVMAENQSNGDIQIGDEVTINMYELRTVIGDKFKDNQYEIDTIISNKPIEYQHTSTQSEMIVEDLVNKYHINTSKLIEMSVPDFIDSYLLEDIDISDGWIYMPKDYGDYTTLIVLETSEAIKLEPVFNEILDGLINSYNEENITNKLLSEIYFNENNAVMLITKK